MGIEKLQFNGGTNVQNSIKNKPSFKGESDYSENPADKEKSIAAKLMIGATALAGVAALGVAGYKGHLGKGIQKFLGGAEKAVEKEGSNIQEAAANAEAKVAKEAELKAAKEAEAKAAREAEEKAAKEAEAKAAKEAELKAAKEAEAKAAREAAREAAQEAYDIEMQERLTPKVRQMIKDLHEKWRDEVEIASNLYEEVEFEGFKSLKNSKDTLKKLDNGALSITHKTSDGKKYQLISKENDTDKLRRIKVFNKDGELSHEIDFYRTHENSRPIDIFEKTGDYCAPDQCLSDYHNFENNHICFITDGKTPKLCEWGNSTGDVLAPERLNHIQSGFGEYCVHYSGNEAKDVLGNSFWLEP